MTRRPRPPLFALLGALVAVLASSAVFELVRPGWAGVGGVCGGTLVLLVAGNHWKNLLFRKLASHKLALAEVRALVGLQDPRFSPPLPWTRWSLPPVALREVLETVELKDAGTVVECGCGLSTVYVAQSLRARGRGRVTSLEHDAAWAGFVRELLERHQLADWADVRHVPLAEREFYGRPTLWYALEEPPLAAAETIDLLVVDGPPGALGPLTRLGAVPFFWSRLSDDAVVVLDDARRPDEAEIAELWCRHHDLRATRIDSEHGLIKLERAAGSGSSEGAA